MLVGSEKKRAVIFKDGAARLKNHAILLRAGYNCHPTMIARRSSFKEQIVKRSLHPGLSHCQAAGFTRYCPVEALMAMTTYGHRLSLPEEIKTK